MVMEIRIVPEAKCPYCGQGFPNRPKVHDEYGWWWKCYNEDCPVLYYNPSVGLVEVETPEGVRVLKYSDLEFV